MTNSKTVMPSPKERESLRKDHKNNLDAISDAADEITDTKDIRLACEVLGRAIDDLDMDSEIQFCVMTQVIGSVMSGINAFYGCRGDFETMLDLKEGIVKKSFERGIHSEEEHQSLRSRLKEERAALEGIGEMMSPE